MAWFMPTLNPASVAEYLSFGEYGYALSRFSGMWVGFKAVSETVESAQSVELLPDRRVRDAGLRDAAGRPALPLARPAGAADRGAAWRRRSTRSGPSPTPTRSTGRSTAIADARYGFVTTGKGASRPDGGAAAARARRGGLPAARHRHLQGRHGLAAGAARRRSTSCATSRRCWSSRRSAAIIESQLKEYFYDYPGHKPRAHGRQARRGGRAADPLDRRAVAAAAGAAGRAKRLDRIFPGEGFLDARGGADRRGRRCCCRWPGATRTPYFCSGCPHNTSTKVPEGSQALAGIGCHFMASWMDRETSSLIQMGGEGVNWAASSRFTGRRPHLPEPRRGHLVPLGLDGDPPGDRGGGQHHLQDPLQRRGGDDRRPAGRRADQRAGDRADRPGRGRRAHRAGLRRPGEVRRRASCRAA